MSAVYFSSGLVINFSLFSAFWILISGGWVLLFKLGLLDGLIAYTTAFIELSFIIGFVFNFFLMKSFKGYMDQPANFRRLLNHITAMARRLFIFLHARRKYQPSTSGMIKHDYVLSSVYDEIRLFESMFKQLIHCASKLFVRKALSKDPFELEGIKHGELVYFKRKNVCFDQQMVDLLADIGIQITRLESEEIIKQSEHKILFEKISDIENTLTDIDISHNIDNPDLFDIHLKLILAAWFLIWLPFTLSIRLGIASLVVYPTIMNLLFGVNIIRHYMKSALDPFRPIKLNSFDRWDEDFQSEITRLSCVNDPNFHDYNFQCEN